VSRTFTWRGKVRISAPGERLRTGGGWRPVTARTQTVQVSTDVYARLTERALEYDVSNKALLEYVLRSVPEMSRRTRNGPAEKRRAIENRARKAA
jgi:hypothetical protein